MKFYSNTQPIETSPYINFIKDNWNDYWTFETLFSAYYFDGSRTYLIGQVKILDKNEHKTILPSAFDSLDDNYCTLGTDTSYYTTMQRLFPDNFEEILESLNDIALFPTIAEEFEIHSGFKTSLLRYSEAEKAYRQAKLILQNVDYKEAFKFQYKCRIENAEEDHIVDFDFSKTNKLPFRITALIGKNGTGKTQFLSNLALDISGQKKTKENIGQFSPQRPPFNKIIAVSYSVFDKFVRPTKNKSFSYKYCGLRDDKGLISQNKLTEIYEVSTKLIKEHNREIVWYNSLKNIIQIAVLDVFYDDLFNNQNFENVSQKGKQNLSSGQSILMFIITEIIANIRDESLILFDEPEMHLHPNAIANLLKSLNVILEKFDSYAILATHSPIILQDIPSKFVHVFDREGNIPIIRALPIESFGENITTITQSVFETIQVRESYKEFLAELAFFESYENIESIFENRMSLNARLYLNSCYRDEKA